MWAYSEKLTYFIEKCRQCRPFEISWNFNIFSNFIKFHKTCRTYWNHHQKHACEIWAYSEKLNFFTEKNWQLEISLNFNIFSKFTNIEKCWQCPLISRNIMKFQHFFKVHKLSTNLQNIFESSSETCMWNLSPFREVDLFHRKMPTVPALWNIMKFQHFFKFHQISSNLQNACIWIIIRKNMHVKYEPYLNHSEMHVEPIQRIIFHRKMLTVPALEISWNFNIFSKFTKFHQTCRTYLNHHQKHACEIWAHSEKLTYFIEKCWQCPPLKYHEISTFFQSSPTFIKLAKHIWIIIRNMHVKFEPFREVLFFTEKCWQYRP